MMMKYRSILVLNLLIVVFIACRPDVMSNEASESHSVEESMVIAVHEEASVTDINQVNDEMVELTIIWWGSNNRHERTIKVIELFEQEYPHITINYQFTGWGDYWDIAAKYAQAGNPPDIMQQDYSRLQEWVAKGWIIPLDSLIHGDGFDASNVAPAVMETGKVDGKLYGVPLGTNSEAIVIDTSAFEKAGLNLPASNWSWADFEQTALDIHSQLEILGMGERLISPPLLWQSYLLGHGQAPYQADGTGLAYQDEHLVDYMTMILRLQKAGAIPPRIKNKTPLIEPELDIESSFLVTNEAAMDYIWSNQLVVLWSVAGETRQFRLMPLPRPINGQPSNYIKPAMFFSITANSKHPVEAITFINYFTNSLEANEVLMGERGVPISSVVRENLLLLLSPAQFEIFRYLGQIELDNSPIPPPNPVYQANIVAKPYYSEFINPILINEITPEVGVARFRERVIHIMSEE